MDLIKVHKDKIHLLLDGWSYLEALSLMKRVVKLVNENVCFLCIMHLDQSRRSSSKVL